MTTRQHLNKGCLLGLTAVVLVCVTFAQSVLPVYAQGLSNDELKALSEYPNWVADSGSDSCGGGNTADLSGNSNLEKIFNFFVQNGFSKIQAAGIVGNIHDESHGDPELYQGDEKDHQVPPGSEGWGIVQWTPPAAILDYAQKESKPAYDLGTQLQLLLKELTGDSLAGQAGKDIKAATTIEDATAAFQGNQQMGGPYIGFERPAAEAKDLPGRIAAAKVALKEYGAGVVDTSSTATAGQASAGGQATTQDPCSGAVAGDAIKTALNYAWPDYHQAPYLVFKPSYRTAIAAAEARGEYVGGGSHPGVDCGGFVTRVMRDSGADPNYNKGNGATTVQQAYMDAHPEKYKRLGPQTSTTNLQPGDIAINSEHTYIYVGKQPGFNGNSASASYSTDGSSWRTPMASNTYWSNGAGPFIWYRLIKQG